MPSTSQAGLGVYTHPPAAPQTYVTPAAQMAAPATQQLQQAAPKYVPAQKRGGGCMHRLRQCTLYYVFADTDARAHAAATLEGHVKAADETGVRVHVRADDTANTRPEGARGRALDTSRKSRRKAAATPRPPRHRHVPLLLAGGIVRVMGRTGKHTVRSTTKTWATSRGSNL